MNVLYAKAVLYAYVHLESIAEQIDEIVEKRALSSSVDFSPAEVLCEKIVNLTYQKGIVLSLKVCALEALKRFNEEELLCLDYKYFHTKNKDEYTSIDPASRRYFRLQIRIAKKFADVMEKIGFTDERFKSECLSMEFFREMLKRVKERENLSRKNKTAKEKEQILKLKAKIAENAVKNKDVSVKNRDGVFTTKSAKAS